MSNNDSSKSTNNSNGNYEIKCDIKRHYIDSGGSYSSKSSVKVKSDLKLKQDIEGIKSDTKLIFNVLDKIIALMCKTHKKMLLNLPGVNIDSDDQQLFRPEFKVKENNCPSPYVC